MNAEEHDDACKMADMSGRVVIQIGTNNPKKKQTERKEPNETNKLKRRYWEMAQKLPPFVGWSSGVERDERAGDPRRAEYEGEERAWLILAIRLPDCWHDGKMDKRGRTLHSEERMQRTKSDRPSRTPTATISM